MNGLKRTCARLSAVWILVCLIYVSWLLMHDGTVLARPEIVGGLLAGIFAPIAVLWISLDYFQRDVDASRLARLVEELRADQARLAQTLTQQMRQIAERTGLQDAQLGAVAAEARLRLEKQVEEGVRAELKALKDRSSRIGEQALAEIGGAGREQVGRINEAATGHLAEIAAAAQKAAEEGRKSAARLADTRDGKLEEMTRAARQVEETGRDALARIGAAAKSAETGIAEAGRAGAARVGGTESLSIAEIEKARAAIAEIGRRSLSDIESAARQRVEALNDAGADKLAEVTETAARRSQALVERIEEVGQAHLGEIERRAADRAEEIGRHLGAAGETHIAALRAEAERQSRRLTDQLMSVRERRESELFDGLESERDQLVRRLKSDVERHLADASAEMAAVRGRFEREIADAASGEIESLRAELKSSAAAAGAALEVAGRDERATIAARGESEKRRTEEEIRGVGAELLEEVRARASQRRGQLLADLDAATGSEMAALKARMTRLAENLAGVERALRGAVDMPAAASPPAAMAERPALVEAETRLPEPRVMERPQLVEPPEPPELPLRGERVTPLVAPEDLDRLLDEVARRFDKYLPVIKGRNYRLHAIGSMRAVMDQPVLGEALDAIRDTSDAPQLKKTMGDYCSRFERLVRQPGDKRDPLQLARHAVTYRNFCTLLDRPAAALDDGASRAESA